MDAAPPWLARLRTLATALDESVTVPGTGFSVGIDPLLGLLPVVGDPFDAYWKANVRNVELAAADLQRQA